DAALIEYLESARAETASTRTGKLLVRAAFDDGYVDACQRQLACQRQARRTSSGDQHRMRPTSRQRIHFLAPILLRFWLQATIVRHNPGLAASPPVRDILRMGGSEFSSLFACPLVDGQALCEAATLRSEQWLPHDVPRPVERQPLMEG